MRTVKINTVSRMKFILSIIFLFKVFLSFGETNSHNRCVEGFPQKRGGVNGEPNSKDSLESQIGYSFKNLELKHIALKQRFVKSYYRHNTLEFLGDAVFDLSVSDLLMEEYPLADEGELSKMRSSLVNTNDLAELALSLSLDHELLLSASELRNKGQLNPRLLASVLEALSCFNIC